MAERLTRRPVAREAGYVYLLGPDGFVWRVPTPSNRGGVRARVGTEPVVREPGWMYFVDRDGFVVRTPRRGAPPGPRDGRASPVPSSGLLVPCPACRELSDPAVGRCASCGGPLG